MFNETCLVLASKITLGSNVTNAGGNAEICSEEWHKHFIEDNFDVWPLYLLTKFVRLVISKTNGGTLGSRRGSSTFLINRASFWYSARMCWEGLFVCLVVLYVKVHLYLLSVLKVIKMLLWMYKCCILYKEKKNIWR